MNLTVSLLHLRCCHLPNNILHRLFQELGVDENTAETMEIPILKILEISGLTIAAEALAGIRWYVDGLPVKLKEYVMNCAEALLPFFEKDVPGDNRPRVALEHARGFLNGTTSQEVLDHALKMAWQVCRDHSASTFPATRAAAAIGYAVEVVDCETNDPHFGYSVGSATTYAKSYLDSLQDAAFREKELARQRDLFVQMFCTESTNP